MSDTLTHLMEFAISTENDEEALGALRKLRKAWKGSGSIKLPNPPKNLPKRVESDGVSASEHRRVIAQFEKINQNLMRDNGQLATANQALLKEKLNGAWNDSEVDALEKSVKSMLWKLGAVALSGWTVAFVLLLVL